MSPSRKTRQYVPWQIEKRFVKHCKYYDAYNQSELMLYEETWPHLEDQNPWSGSWSLALESQGGERNTL